MLSQTDKLNMRLGNLFLGFSDTIPVLSHLTRNNNCLACSLNSDTMHYVVLSELDALCSLTWALHLTNNNLSETGWKERKLSVAIQRFTCPKESTTYLEHFKSKSI